MFKLDLSEWKIKVMVPAPTEEEPHGMKEIEQVYPFKRNISDILRAPGIFRSGEEIAEAVVLAKTVRDTRDESVNLDAREAEILKKAFNRIIEATADGKSSIMLGGELHEEAILRVFNIEEVK